MKLTLIDRIIELSPGKFIKATKSLAMNEGYLEDHFPRFPVMPGVLMLESMYQTAAWLVRATDDFAYSIVALSEAKNVKYSDFVTPGQTLRVTAEVIKQVDDFTTLKCQGEVDDRVAVRGRLVLERFNLADRGECDSMVDKHVINSLRKKFQLLYTIYNSETKE